MLGVEEVTTMLMKFFVEGNNEYVELVVVLDEIQFFFTNQNSQNWK